MSEPINTQPLLTHSHLDHGSLLYHYLHFRDILEPTLNPIKAGVDPTLWNKAYFVGNQIGYNFDTVMNYLMNQVGIRNDKLTFIPNEFPNPNRDANNQIINQQNPKELKEHISQYGIKFGVSQNTRLIIEFFETMAGICTMQELMTAIAYQFVHNSDHYITLQIGQNPELLADYHQLSTNWVTDNGAKIPFANAQFDPTTGTIKLD